MATESGVNLQIVGIDHIVIRVKDVEGALAFYTATLGMEPHRVEDGGVEERRASLPVRAHQRQHAHRPEAVDGG